MYLYIYINYLYICRYYTYYEIMNIVWNYTYICTFRCYMYSYGYMYGLLGFLKDCIRRYLFTIVHDFMTGILISRALKFLSVSISPVTELMQETFWSLDIFGKPESHRNAFDGRNPGPPDMNDTRFNRFFSISTGAGFFHQQFVLNPVDFHQKPTSGFACRWMSALVVPGVF